jgi:cytochrome P450
MAGHETTASAMSQTLRLLALHPDIRQRLFDGDQSLIPTAVEEFLRSTTPIQVFGRNAAHDITLHGREIKTGDVVGIAFGAANHDPEAFTCPEGLDNTRHPNKHLAFGFGPQRVDPGLALRSEALGFRAVLIRTSATQLCHQGSRHSSGAMSPE